MSSKKQRTYRKGAEHAYTLTTRGNSTMLKLNEEHFKKQPRDTTRKRCSKCGQLLPKPYKPRPICKCGAKRWTEYYRFNDDGQTTILRCAKCGREVKP